MSNGGCGSNIVIEEEVDFFSLSFCDKKVLWVIRFWGFVVMII